MDGTSRGPAGIPLADLRWSAYKLSCVCVCMCLGVCLRVCVIRSRTPQSDLPTPVPTSKDVDSAKRPMCVAWPDAVWPHSVRRTRGGRHGQHTRLKLKPRNAQARRPSVQLPGRKAAVEHMSGLAPKRDDA